MNFIYSSNDFQRKVNADNLTNEGADEGICDVRTRCKQRLCKQCLLQILVYPNLALPELLILIQPNIEKHILRDSF